ncbi:forkhead box protein pes-1-like [Lineus longissimus]|uniref:forkhead box protein pes-1-like n=1 Tax=Lineus longissimus TaxID=88925 RepID=UPI00315C8472
MQSSTDPSLTVLKHLASTLGSEGSEHNSSDTSEESVEPQVSSTTEKTSPGPGAFVTYTSPERTLLQQCSPVYSTSTPLQNRYEYPLYPQLPVTSPIFSRQVTARTSPIFPGQGTTETDTSDAPPDRKKRPNISYTALIAMAILNSRERKLQLHQIYDFIQYKFPYYQTTTSKWKNCVRHNLSLSDRFVKLGRKDTRGNFWAINEKYYEELVRNISQNTDIAHMNYPALASAMGYQAMSFPGLPQMIPGGYLPPVTIPSTVFTGHLSSPSPFPALSVATSPSPYQPGTSVITPQPYPGLESPSAFHSYPYSHSQGYSHLAHGLSHPAQELSRHPTQGLSGYSSGHQYRFRPY